MTTFRLSPRKANALSSEFSTAVQPRAEANAPARGPYETVREVDIVLPEIERLARLGYPGSDKLLALGVPIEWMLPTDSAGCNFQSNLVVHGSLDNSGHLSF